MTEEKKYILSLIDDKISSLKEELNKIRLRFSCIPFYQSIIDKINENSNYKLYFVGELDDEKIKDILSLLDSNEQQELFKASIMSIKGLIEINKSNDSINCEYNESQIKTINNFFELLKKKTENDSKKYDFESNKINILIKKYSDFKRRLSLGLRLELVDFDLMEELLKEKESLNIKSSIIIKYLSIYNLEALEGKKTDKYNPFEFNEITETKEEKDNNLLKKVCKKLGFSYEKLKESQRKNLMKNPDIKNINDFVEYLVSNSYSGLNSSVLCIILGNSSLKCFSEMILILEELELSKSNINSLLESYTYLFTIDGYNNFKRNLSLIEQYEVNSKKFLMQTPLFFLRNPEENRKGLESINKYINVKGLLMNVPSLFNVGYDQIVGNINILNSYGYKDLGDQNPNGYTLLGAIDLPLILDRLIELGLNNYIHEKSDESVKMTKSLIIKRVFFSSKNNISAWKKDENTINEGFVDIPEKEEFEKAIIDYRRVLTEEEINELIKAYPILEELDSACRPALYDDNDFSKLKRKTELLIENKIVSRQKVYSIFKAIMENVNHANEKDALMYSICYNSLLEYYEYIAFNNAIYRNSMLGAVNK